MDRVSFFWRKPWLVRQLALAHFIEREIEEGRIESYAEFAGRLGVSRARVSQIAGMVLKPLAVQEAIVRGEVVIRERTIRMPHPAATPMWEGRLEPVTR